MLDEPLDSLDLPNQAAVARSSQRICRAENVAVLLVAHDVNPLLGYLDQVDLSGGRQRGRRARSATSSRPDADARCTGCRSRCCAPATGGWSSSASPRRLTPRPPARATVASMGRTNALVEPRLRRARAARLPVHGQRLVARGDRGRDGRRGRLVHGSARRELRRAHARGDGLSGRAAAPRSRTAGARWATSLLRRSPRSRSAAQRGAGRRFAAASRPRSASCRWSRLRSAFSSSASTAACSSSWSRCCSAPSSGSSRPGADAGDRRAGGPARAAHRGPAVAAGLARPRTWRAHGASRCGPGRWLL